MSTSSLLRLGGLAAMVAGILIAVYNVLEYLFFSDYAKTAQSAAWFPFQVMGVVAIALALLGLTALYAMQAARAGTFGLVSFVVAFVGLVQFYSIQWLLAFLAPALSKTAPQLLETPEDSFFAAGFFSTILLFVIGSILFGVSALRSKALPRWTGWLLIGGTLLFLVGEMVGTFIGPVAAIAYGVAFAGMGRSCSSRSKQPESSRVTQERANLACSGRLGLGAFFEPFSWLWQFSVSRTVSPQPPLTQTVSHLSVKNQCIDIIYTRRYTVS